MRGILIAATLLGTFVRASAAAPTAITFAVNHADCDAAGSHTFAFTLNDVLLGTAPTSQDCVCNSDPLVVTFTEPASLALFDPTTCNSFRVDTSGGADSVLLGFIRVTVSSADGPADACLFDGWVGNAQLRCAARSLCEDPFFDSGVVSAGGSDADGDGIVAGIGVGCDGCPGVANPDQADGDGDGVDDACDDCPAVADPAQTDTDGDGMGNVCDPCPNGGDDDGDGVCDDVDDCLFVWDPDQADGDGDGFGDACDGCVGQGTTDADADGACDEVDVCPTVPDPAQMDGDGDGLGDACDNCPVFNPGQEDGNGDGIADACSPGVSIAGIAAAGGVIQADVRVTSPLGNPLTGMVRILDDSGVTALVYTWLATSCETDQDTLDLTVNGASVARVVPEPGGPFCVCTPAVASVTVPLADAVALLQPGVNQLGIRKSTALPTMSATGIAWAYATLTVGGVPARVEILDVMGGNDFDDPDLCGAGYTFQAVEGATDTAALPPPALSLAWTGEPPCSVDLSALAPDRSYLLTVSATDGLVAAPTADARRFDRASEALLTMAGASCDDANPCTSDTCTAGGCVHVPVVCPAADQCHDAGVCDPATGTCTSPARPDGTACDDGNGCTRADTCHAGTCTGGDPVVCPLADQCHDAGMCDPATGRCTSPVSPDGAACDDGNACTRTDTCQAGTCTGGDPIVCPLADQCHDAGVCDLATGACTSPASPDGTTCDDGNVCTRTDACRQGHCVGLDGVVCLRPDRCHKAYCKRRQGTCHVKRIRPQRFCTDNRKAKHRDRGRGPSPERR